MTSYSLSLIMPIHNQEGHVRDIVTKVIKSLTRYKIDYEIILVPNACSDNSAEVCSQLSKEYPNVFCQETSSPGWGHALLFAFPHCTKNTIGYTNSARFNSESFELVLTESIKHPTFLLKAARIKRLNFFRKIGSFLYNMQAHLLHSIQSNDVNGTPKFFPRQALQKISLLENGDLIDLELLKKIRRLPLKIQEIPIVEAERAGGVSTTKILSALKMYGGSLRIWFKGLI